MTTEYAKFLKEGMKAQRAYIRGEQKRMAKARQLWARYDAAMRDLGLHPLVLNELVDRQKELEGMLANIEQTHGDTEGQRAIFRVFGNRAAA